MDRPLLLERRVLGPAADRRLKIITLLDRRRAAFDWEKKAERKRGKTGVGKVTYNHVDFLDVDEARLLETLFLQLQAEDVKGAAELLPAFVKDLAPLPERALWGDCPVLADDVRGRLVGLDPAPRLQNPVSFLE